MVEAQKKGIKWIFAVTENGKAAAELSTAADVQHFLGSWNTNEGGNNIKFSRM